MVQITIEEVRNKLFQASRIRGLPDKEAKILADYYLDANLRGAKTHGVGRFLVISEAIETRGGPPIIVKDTPVASLVDGQRDLGPLAAQFCVELLISKVKNNGIGLVALKNASRYSHLAPYGSYIASKGYIGIVSNSAGPAAVAPYGSFTPILGTNPLCISFPSAEQSPIVMDFATSETVWGEIRQALLEGRDLKQNAFYTNDGKIAVHPEEANAVKSFDGAKGFALCLAIEIICGAFVGSKMGSLVNDEYELGFLFMALDPMLFRENMEDFKSEVGRLAQEIRNASPLDINMPVRLPGDHSLQEKEIREQIGSIEIDEKSWDLLCLMSKDPKAGMISSQLTN